MTAPRLPGGRSALDAPPVSAIILAGGRSTRMGRDKASVMLDGRPLIQHVLDRVAPLVRDVVVVRAVGQALPPLDSPRPLAIVDDLLPAAGPLVGLYSGLTAAPRPRSLVVACDMPLLVPSLLRELIRRSSMYDVVIPVLDRPQPLHAVYAASCLPAIQRRIDAGDRRLTSFLEDVRVHWLDEATCRRFDPDLRSFLNTNTPDALRHVETLLPRDLAAAR